jgi:hypothetical protein
MLDVNYIRTYEFVEKKKTVSLYQLLFPKSWFTLKLRLTKSLKSLNLYEYLELRMNVKEIGTNSLLGMVDLSAGLDSIKPSKHHNIYDTLVFIAPVYDSLPATLIEKSEFAVMNYSMARDVLQIRQKVKYIFYSSSYDKTLIQENRLIAPDIMHIERSKTALKLKTPWTLNLGNWALQYLYEEALYRLDLWGIDLQLTVDRSKDYYVDNSGRIARWYKQACEHDPVYMFEHIKKLQEVGLVFSSEKTSSKSLLDMDIKDFNEALLVSYGI